MWRLLLRCHGHPTPKVIDFNGVLSAVVVPQILIKYLLHASHDSLGHVWAMKLYHFLKQLYYLKGMRRKLHEYMRSFHKCQIMNLQKPRFIDLHQDITQTQQDHLSINLLGLYDATSQGNIYVLTAVCNLTGYLMTNPIRNKKATSVVNHLFADIMLKFGFSRKLHSGNGMEFKWKPLTITWCKENFHFPLLPTRKWKTRILTQIY